MTAPRGQEPFRRERDGFAVELPAEARRLLASIAGQMREVLTADTAADDPAVARLFPQAYDDDPLRTIGFDEVAGDGLRRQRLDRLEVLAATAEAPWLTEDQLLDWMRAINDVRIVLGVRLGVTEETTIDDVGGREDVFRTYAYLSALLETIVQALGDPAA